MFSDVRGAALKELNAILDQLEDLIHEVITHQTKVGARCRSDALLPFCAWLSRFAACRSLLAFRFPACSGDEFSALMAVWQVEAKETKAAAASPAAAAAAAGTPTSAEGKDKTGAAAGSAGSAGAAAPGGPTDGKGPEGVPSGSAATGAC